MGLLNVRLNEMDSKIAEALRSQGVVLSDLVRDSLRAEYCRRRRPRSAKAALCELKRILESYPDSPDDPPRAYDVADAKAARAAIRQSLLRKKARP